MIEKCALFSYIDAVSAAVNECVQAEDRRHKMTNDEKTEAGIIILEAILDLLKALKKLMVFYKKQSTKADVFRGFLY